MEMQVKLQIFNLCQSSSGIQNDLMQQTRNFQNDNQSIHGCLVTKTLDIEINESIH